MDNYPHHTNYYNPNPYNQGQPMMINGDYPGKTLGIVGLVLSLISIVGIPSAIIGAIIGHVALKQSKAAGYSNTPALVAIIVGWVVTALVLLAILLLVLTWMGAAVSMRGAY